MNARTASIRPATGLPLQKPQLWSALLSTPTVLLAWTVGRLGLIPVIILSYGVSPLLTAIALTAFVAADLYDGVLARQLEADTPSRRILDSIVDRISIWSVYIALAVVGVMPILLLGLLLGRDLYCGIWCHRMVRTRNIAIKADGLYRALNLMLAAWVVVAPMISSSTRASLFVGIFLFSIVVAVDLRRAVGKVLEMPPEVRDLVIDAGDLRGS